MKNEPIDKDNKSQTQIVTFHLPQFHTFPENDEWWGKGFTEWVNVKNAKPLYKGHNQPRVPLNNNYYDLSKIENMVAQMDLAREYGIHAFCYYHYWFDGKLLLQKPLEAIRDYQGVKLNYFLCWANEPWARTWDGHETDVLMPQRYGDRLEWEQHFEYLLSFFKDQYYEKIDNKPVLVLYRCTSIPKCEEMIACWNQLCKQNGFDGIYIIEEKNSFQNKPVCKNSNAYLYFEPGYTLNFGRTKFEHARDKAITVAFNLSKHSHNLVNVYSWIWQRLLFNTKKDLGQNDTGKEIFPGAFVGWDKTPRKKDKGRFIVGNTPEIFGKYFSRQFSQAKEAGCRYLFINAWNEWGEGAFLEPDETFEYSYLECIKDVSHT